MDIRYGREFLAGRYGPGARDQRLEEFGQGRWADAGRPSAWLSMTAADVSRPEVLADAMVAELRRGAAPRPVESDGARRAAKMLAELI